MLAFFFCFGIGGSLNPDYLNEGKDDLWSDDPQQVEEPAALLLLLV
jgi:hypothetical protein